MNRIVARIGLCIVAAALPSCGQPPAGGPGGERPPVAVTTFAAVERSVPLYLDEIGRCAASEEISVEPQVSGQITEVLFVDGAPLERHAPLFTIDKRPYAAKLAEAKARSAAATAGVAQAKAARDTAAAKVGTAKSKREQARASLTVAQATSEAASSTRAAAESEGSRAAADLERFEGVSKTGGVSQQELDRVRSDKTSADARLAAARQREAAAVAQGIESAAAATTAERGIAEAESQLAEAEAKIASATADVTQAEAAVQTAELDLEYCSITAPIAGRAGRRMIDLGNVVTANQSVLLTIRKLDPAYIEFTVTENDLSAVQRYMARGALAVEVRLPDELAAPGMGTLTFLDNVVHDASGTIRLRASVANPDGRFWPGRFVKVRLVLDTLKTAVLLPASAVLTSAEGSIVWVVEGGKASIRPVVLGQRHDEMVVVVQGLKPGEKVVVVGQMTLMPGAKVAEPQAPPPASGGAPAPGETPVAPAMAAGAGS